MTLPNLDLPPPTYEDHRPIPSLLNRLGLSIPVLNSPRIWGIKEKSNQRSADDGWEQSEEVFSTPVQFEDNDLQSGFDQRDDDPLPQDSTGDVPPCCGEVRWEAYHAV